MNRLKHHIISIFSLMLSRMGLLIFILLKPSTSRKMARRSFEFVNLEYGFFFLSLDSRCHIDFMRHKIFICIYFHFLKLFFFHHTQALFTHFICTSSRYNKLMSLYAHSRSLCCTWYSSKRLCECLTWFKKIYVLLFPVLSLTYKFVTVSPTWRTKLEADSNAIIEDERSWATSLKTSTIPDQL